ncbi:MAG: amidohydrolase family protein [Hespellia sp.]|nr:amidohydrolase family protein [Hespellia sp.]
MIVDSHEHIMLPTEKQIQMMDKAGVDKTVLFCSAPHPEKAATLDEMEAEMNSLYKLLAGANSKEANIVRQRRNIAELVTIIKNYPDRFYGFGSVPLGMSLKETEEWIYNHIIANSLQGIGEFTPGNEQQILQLDAIFEAMRGTKVYPVWVHTFNPVTMDGIKLLMGLCEKYPEIPVVFGHLGGTNWIEVIKFARTHKNIYLDLSAAFASIATKMALIELPERCLYTSDAPYGEPYLYRELIEFSSPSKATANMVLGDNIMKLLNI